MIIETSFPNELQDLANVSGHLTPQTLDLELRKLKQDVPVYLYGFKPRHLARIRKQVRALKRRRARRSSSRARPTGSRAARPRPAAGAG